ncbi:hypothetical protein CXB51_003948 [Gossypium anomalum]|uniref:CRIB domain-containing protein n=1 Tax=Gossypium anomalum TaxID=47600 RepID=A0A8J5Z367_9ROSI|nr:hypothetical protein CXB51_003948 [Gossypium anomalum]
MRDKMEKLVILPFSVGCVSDSSVAVAAQRHHHHQPRRSKPPPAAADTNSNAKRTQEEDEDSLSSENMKYSLKLLPLPKLTYQLGLIGSSPRVSRHYLSYLLLALVVQAYKDEIEESENEMEIGFPTDVKHVTHIGLDGSASTSPSNGSWDNRLSLHDLFTFPSSIAPSGQCELPMETHPEAASPFVQAHN